MNLLCVITYTLRIPTIPCEIHLQYNYGNEMSGKSTQLEQIMKFHKISYLLDISKDHESVILSKL